MTNDQLLQKLQERRGERGDNLNARDVQINLFRKQMEDLADDNRVSLAHIEEIDFALEQLKPHSEPAAPPAPAQATEKRDTLAECIAAIRSTFIMPLREGVTDRMAQEQLEKAGHKYRLPTVRNALKQIGSEPRAAETVPGNPPSERIAVSSLPEATPSNGGAGPDTEMPGFLKRSPKQAAE